MSDNEVIMARLVQQDAAQKQAREEKIARIEAMLQARSSAPVSVNLAPLAGLADSMSGSKISEGVASQAADAQGFNKRNEALLDQLTAAKSDTGSTPAGLLRSGNEDGKNSRQFESQSFNAFKELAEKVGKTNDEAVSGFTQADRMEAAFQTKDPREVGAAMNELARVIQGVKGSMAEGDVNRSFFEDYATLLNKGATKIGLDGRLSDEAIAPVLVQIGRFRDALTKTTQSKLARYETTYGGNKAYSSAVGELRAGGAFNYIDPYLKKQPPIAAGSLAPGIAAPASGLSGVDWKAKAAARKSQGI